MQSLTSAVKMVGKSVAKKEEIRANIKARSKIGCSLKQIFVEISVVYESSNVFYDTVRTRVLQKVLSLGSDYFSATFYQTYFYYKPSKYSPFTETHFCNLFTQSQKADK